MKTSLKWVSMVLSLCCLASAANAQEDQPEKKENSTKYSSNEEWYVQLQGGANAIICENMADGPFSKRISPTYAVSVGKNFTTRYGLRLQMIGGGDKGRYYPSEDSPYYSFKHFSGIVEGTLNVTNFIRTAKRGDESKWNLLLMLGPGVTYAYDYKNYNTEYVGSYDQDYTARAYLLIYGGGELSYRFSSHWNVNLEASTTWTSDRYNGIKFDRPLDALVNLMGGVRYTF